MLQGISRSRLQLKRGVCTALRSSVSIYLSLSVSAPGNKFPVSILPGVRGETALTAEMLTVAVTSPPITALSVTSWPMGGVLSPLGGRFGGKWSLRA